MKYFFGRIWCTASDPMPIHPDKQISTVTDVQELAFDEFYQGLGYRKTLKFLNKWSFEPLYSSTHLET